MLFYRFQIEVSLPPQFVMQRLRSLVRNRPRLRQWLGERWDSALPPFIGTVDEDSFRMRRYIRGGRSGTGSSTSMNPIRGHVFQTQTGTQINVTVFMHPAAMVWTTLWLVGWGFATVVELRMGNFGPVAVFMVSILVICGFFFPEAFKVKRILTDAFSDSAITPQTSGSQVQ